MPGRARGSRAGIVPGPLPGEPCSWMVERMSRAMQVKGAPRHSRKEGKSYAWAATGSSILDVRIVAATNESLEEGGGRKLPPGCVLHRLNAARLP